MQDIKVGDTVHVRGVVKSPFGKVGYYVIEFNDEILASLPTDTIVHVEPRTLAVGDRVQFGHRKDEWRGEIIGIDPASGKLWVRDEDGPGTRHSRDLVRA